MLKKKTKLKTNMKESIELGINSFGLGSLLTNNSMNEFVRKMKEFGIQNFEPCVFFLGIKHKNKENNKKQSHNTTGIWMSSEAEEKIQCLRNLGMQVHGIHLMSLSLNQNVIDEAISFAKDNKLSYVVISLETKNHNKIRKLLPILCYASNQFSRLGISFLYHNHSEDLKNIDGSSVLDNLLQNIPNLGLQLDLGWVQFAGFDCLKMMESYKDKIQSLHFKDIWPDAKLEERSSCLTAIGEGCIPLIRIIEKAKELNLPSYSYIIDQDASLDDMETDIRIGANHILHKTQSQSSLISGIYNGSIPLSLMTFPFGIEVLRKHLSYEQIIHIAAYHGIQSLDIMDHEARIFNTKAIKNAMEKEHMEIACLIVSITMTKGNQKRIQKKISNSILLAQKIGTKLLMLIPMPQKESFFQKISKEEKFKRCVPYLKFAVTEGSKYGIKICVEDTPSCMVPLSSTKECKAMLDAVPGLGLVYDTANMLAQGDDPITFYETLKEHIVHVHLKDVVKSNNRSFDICSDGTYLKCCPWGQGLVPVKEIYDRLYQDNFAGICAVEYTLPKASGRIANHLQLRNFLRYLE
jgi:sugar phosphate isomerase/epimerase